MPRPRPFTPFVLLGPLLIAACPGPDSPGPDAGAEVQSVSVPFAAMVGDEQFHCSDDEGPRLYTGLGTASSSATFRDFRLYVSGVQLIDEAGDAVAVTLDQSNWQHDDVALLDFEDGTGNCIDVGNGDTHAEITGTVPVGTYRGLRFDIAVPFDKNHLNAADANTPSPLNIMSLFWNWQGGHKYARIDFAVEGSDGWNVHLGATGCVADATDVAPTTNCGKPNVPHIALPDFDPDRDTVVLDAAALVSEADLTANVDGPPGCQSFPADAQDCALVFPAWGLDFASGACTNNCDNQRVFRVP